MVLCLVFPYFLLFFNNIYINFLVMIMMIITTLIKIKNTKLIFKTTYNDITPVNYNNKIFPLKSVEI